MSLQLSVETCPTVRNEMTAFLCAFQNHPVKFVKQLAGVEQEDEA